MAEAMFWRIVFRLLLCVARYTDDHRRSASILPAGIVIAMSTLPKNLCRVLTVVCCVLLERAPCVKPLGISSPRGVYAYALDLKQHCFRSQGTHCKRLFAQNPCRTPHGRWRKNNKASLLRPTKVNAALCFRSSSPASFAHCVLYIGVTSLQDSWRPEVKSLELQVIV